MRSARSAAAEAEGLIAFFQNADVLQPSIIFRVIEAVPDDELVGYLESAVGDMDGPQAAATRRKLLDMVSADKMQVAFYHAPFPATGYIAKSGNGYELVPVQWTPAI